MSARKIPPVGTPAADKLIERVKRGEMAQVCEELGFANKDSLERSLRSVYGIYAKDILWQATVNGSDTIKYLPYPEIKLTPFKQPKSKRDEEDICFVISDPHLGKITASYNLDIATARLDYLLDSAMTIINLHRPIRKAHIFMLGDIVQGENPFQGSKVGETSKGVYEQIHDDAIPLMTRFCLSLTQGVGSVDVYGVRGNHGRYAREAPDKTNWDRFFYKSLADAMINQKSVKVYPASEFYQLINIKGFRFFLIHGDQARGNAGVPVIALRRKMQEWFSYVGGFNHAYCHTPETQIWYPDGNISKISQVKRGARLFDASGNYNTVQDIIKRDYHGDILKIKVRGLPQELSVTPEHPLYVRKQSCAWEKAGDIKVGDHIKVATPKAQYKKYDREEEWCKLLGLYLAEGNIYKYCVTFAFHKKETNLISQTQEYLAKYYKNKISLRSVGPNCTTVRITDKQAVGDFSRDGGKGALNKRLHKSFMLMSKEKQKLILEYWLLGDGHKRVGDYQGYTISGKLARQMLMISWRLGYHATLRTKPAYDYHKQSYTLSIPMRDWNNNKWRKHSSKNLWFRITDIKREHYDGDIYNLIMSHRRKTEPSYCAQGIASHNSGHFHTGYFDQVNTNADYTICPPLVTGDEWAIEMVGRASQPKQLCFGVHDRYGRTFRYDLHTDRAFLPNKFDEAEGEVKLS